MREKLLRNPISSQHADFRVGELWEEGGQGGSEEMRHCEELFPARDVAASNFPFGGFDLH